jgi:hypothetical protein
MGRIYTAAFSGQAETVQVDLLEILAPATRIVVVHEIGISQLLDVKDAEEEMLLLLWKSGQTTGGSGGNVNAVVPVLIADAAATTVVENTNTTKASAGTIVTHYAWHWNVRIPFQMIWTPETRPILAPSRRATLELATTPADSITYGGYIVFEEIG